jgi:hypothetical protein
MIYFFSFFKSNSFGERVEVKEEEEKKGEMIFFVE